MLKLNVSRKQNSKQKNLPSIFLKILTICFVLQMTMFNLANAQNAGVPPITTPPPASPPSQQMIPPAPIPTTLQSPSTTIVAAPTSPPSVPASAPNQQQMSVSQFEQWLQTNGYGQTSAPRPTGTVPSISGNGRRSPGLRPPTNGSAQRLPTNIAMPGSTGVRREVRRTRRTSCGPLTYEQSLRAMLNSVPPDNPAPSQDAVIAFKNMLQQNMPLSPRQVIQLHQQIDRAQRAAAVSPTVPPKPVSSTLMINLAPGTTPPVVRLAQGYVSSLVFVDSTGSPWPVASFDIGNPKSMNIQWDGKSNILLLQAVLPYSDGNIVIRLVGLATPITLELVAGQRVVDYRVDIHVSGIGPNTKEVPIGTSLPDSANQLLLGVLDGVAPPGSRMLTVIGVHSEAWLLGDRLYLRTRFNVLSPGWTGKMSSVDGMHAYELPRTSSVLISRYGEPVEIKIEGL